MEVRYLIAVALIVASTVGAIWLYRVDRHERMPHHLKKKRSSSKSASSSGKEA